MRSELQNSTLGFPVFADDSTAIGTGKPGLSLTIKLRKNGGSENTVSPAVTDLGGGTYWIVPLAAHRDTLGVNVWTLSAAGAVIAPVYERITAVNDQVAAYGANTVAPDNTGIGNAAAAAASADNKLTSGRLSRLDRLPDVIAGNTGGLALVGSQMALTNDNLTALFADADVSGLIASVSALFDNAGDLPIQTIAAQAASQTVAAIVANGSILTLLADAAAAKVAAQAVNNRLPASPAAVADVQITVNPTTLDSTERNAIATAVVAQSVIVGIKQTSDRLATAIEQDGSVWRFTANAVELAAAGGLDPEDLVADIVEALTTLESRPLAIVQVPAAGTSLYAYQATTWKVQIRNLPPRANWQRIWFSIKPDDCCSEDQAIVRIQITEDDAQQTTDGLQRINGRAPREGEDGSITVDEATPNLELTLHLSAAASSLLSVGDYTYDLKIRDADGVELAIEPDAFEIRPSITHAIA